MDVIFLAPTVTRRKFGAQSPVLEVQKKTLSESEPQADIKCQS
jgi:hypothetical protein